MDKQRVIDQFLTEVGAAPTDLKLDLVTETKTPYSQKKQWAGTATANGVVYTVDVTVDACNGQEEETFVYLSPVVQEKSQWDYLDEDGDGEIVPLLPL